MFVERLQRVVVFFFSWVLLTSFGVAQSEIKRLNLQARTGTFYFAQAGGGGGASTAITLVNPSSTTTASGTLSFFGSDGKQLGSVVTSPVVQFQIPPSGAFTAKTSPQAAATSGYASISTADSLLAYASYTIPGLPLLVAEPSASNAFVFSAPVSRDISNGTEVGVAVANVSNTKVRVVVSVSDSRGGRVKFGTTSIDLAPGEQFSRSLLELLPGLPQNFTGTLVISALSPLPSQSLAVTVVQFGAGTVRTVPIQVTDEVVDPVGDFLPTYVGPRAGDLDVVSAQVTFTGTEFLFSGTMDAPIGTTPQAFYVFGVDRGIGSRTSNFTKLGLPDIVFDLVVLVRPGGDSVVNDLDAGIRTPLPATNITINGKNIVARVPLSMLPSKGFTPQYYTWNLWPRWGGIPFSDPQVSDFAPDDRNATVRSDEILDPVGDFLPTYVGPRAGDLDVVSARVTFTGTEFLFSGTMDAPIGTTPQAFYVFGVDRGIGSRTSNFTELGLPDIVFDLVVSVRPGGNSVVNDLDAGIRTPLPAANITINGKNIVARVPLSMLPSKGFTPRNYKWNLWPRWGGIPFSDPQVSDFAPDNRNASVSAAP